MLKIRIGNDIPILWRFFTRSDEGERIPYFLEGKNVKVIMTDCYGQKTEVPDVVILDNSASWIFRGKDQTKVGAYTFTFYENYGQNMMKTLDRIQPLRLVTEQETIEIGPEEESVSRGGALIFESEFKETTDYETLANKPKINHVVLVGDVSLEDLSIASIEDLQQEVTRAQQAEGALDEAIDAETTRATTKEAEITTALQQEVTRAQQAEGGLGTRLSEVEGKIPSQASATNQLADKAFVNSSIATETADFRGTSATGLTEAQFLAWANGLTKNNNDYVFWNTTDAAGNVQFKRYKYNGSAWAYEYTLNNSSFTAAQWATINSGLTSSDKTALDNALALIATYGNIVTHNAEEFATANQGAKADEAKAAIDTYGNIVTHNANEFATAAQGTKADTALQQSDLTPYRTADAQDIIDAGKQDNVYLSVVDGKLCITYNQ